MKPTFQVTLSPLSYPFLISFPLLCTLPLPLPSPTHLPQTKVLEKIAAYSKIPDYNYQLLVVDYSCWFLLQITVVDLLQIADWFWQIAFSCFNIILFSGCKLSGRQTDCWSLWRGIRRHISIELRPSREYTRTSWARDNHD